MKNILYLHAGAELYGADIVLLQLMKNLDKEKYKLHIILPCDGPLVKEMENIGAKVSVLEYPILRRKYFNPKGIIDYAIEFKRNVKILKKYCLDNNIEVVHSNTMAVLEGAALKRALDIHHVWHIHEIITKPKVINKFLCKVISKTANRVIAVSNAVKNHLLDTGYFKTTPVDVIYNGIDNTVFNENNKVDYLKEEYNIKEDEVVVGLIGRVNSWKGQESFLEALNHVLPKYPKAKAMMVGGVFQGEEWRMESLKEKVENSPAKDRIIVEDYRSDTKNVHCLYDIFVLPSIQPDPLPTVVLEAMASGKPVIGYRHGGVTEMVKENYNGLFAEVCDPEDLGKKIEVLLNDKNLRETYGKNSCTRQRESFSLESYVRNFEKVYDIRSERER
ncbi:glycosyltransferase family 4 protein [Clostridium sp.]|uniref:glycosyltransferase family 4 protein n=1 Tax=Clostridium sp. TaxID=1506 RepID=UPI003463C6BF